MSKISILFGILMMHYSNGRMSLNLPMLLALTACGDSSSSNPDPAPTLIFSAAPSAITAGESSTLSWSTTNAGDCTATGD